MKPNEPTITDASELSGWRKSSYSGGSSGNCLEVNDTCAVRDSKKPTGPALIFSAPTWGAFVASLTER
ncbi:DUF397 domain-containing protein [Streptomyces broussonetiae]|uniref:DUF397 domain-containing protein n=1 Tax=Streptomyces broussonetiae TaxID=2686304 RepID=A0ABV5EFL2_9ACTN